MRKSMWGFAVAILLLLGGCAQKAVEADASQDPKTDVSEDSMVSEVETSEISNADTLNSDIQSSTQSTADESADSSDDTNTFENTTDSVAIEPEVAPEEEKVDESVVMQGVEDRLDSIYFAFDSFAITNENQDAIDSNVDIFQEDSAKDFIIKVEGNCDEWGTDEYNYALGLKRAKATKDVLVRKGIDENRILMVSYGESNPVCDEHTQGCWAKNRRVDFKILP